MSNNFISMKQIWADYDTTVEMEICVSVADTFCKGSAKFTNTIYTNVGQISQMLDKLSGFFDQTASNLEIELGGHGKQLANGFTKIKMQKSPKGLICITVFQQSDFGPTANVTIANEAKLHLVCEASAIDRFVQDYRKARASNFCDEVLPVGISKDYFISPTHNLTEEVIWVCRDRFQVVELQDYF